MPDVVPDMTGRRLILCYLGLPAFIFLAGFVRLEFAIPLMLLLGLALLIEMRGARSGINWANTAVYTALAALLLVIAGFPQGPFSWDWFKHWALFDALVSNDWPVMVEVDGVPQFLRYYLGAYLPPALLSKWTALPGWLTFALWLGLGFALVLKLVSSVSPGRGGLSVLAACLLFLAVAGADAWMMLLLRTLSHAPPVDYFALHTEWWLNTNFQIRAQYSSMLTALIWVPHQSIATFLVAGMLLLDKYSERLASSVLAFGFLALWSPFGMIGLLPLITLRTWAAGGQLGSLRFLLALVAGVSFAVLVADYLAGGTPQATLCFSCLPERLSRELPIYLLFWYVELVFFLLILGRRLWSEPECRISLGVLLILPLIGGTSADVLMRVSLGPLFILALRSVQVVMRQQSVNVYAVLLALGLSMPSVVGEVVYQWQSGRAHQELAQRFAQDPLAGRWYYTFARVSDISLTRYLEITAPQVHEHYFTGTVPRIYRQPGD